MRTWTHITNRSHLPLIPQIPQTSIKSSATSAGLGIAPNCSSWQGLLPGSMSAGATPALFHWEFISETKAKVRGCLNLGTWPNLQRQRTLSSTMLINDYTLPLQNINSLHSGFLSQVCRKGLKKKKTGKATTTRPDQAYFPTVTLNGLPHPTPAWFGPEVKR